jgi:hypothetical protein
MLAYIDYCIVQVLLRQSPERRAPADCHGPGSHANLGDLPTDLERRLG